MREVGGWRLGSGEESFFFVGFVGGRVRVRGLGVFVTWCLRSFEFGIFCF